MDKKTLKKFNAILKNVPTTPGVYKFISGGVVLYVGKAKNLKNRLKTYFRKDDRRQLRIEKLLEKVDDLEYIVVDSELEAFVLETNLIKELNPRYNVLMKDDKNYVYIKVTQNEDYPRVEIVRRMLKDKAKYFGPKTSGASARQTVDLLHKLFRFRNCKLTIDAKIKNGGYVNDGEDSIKVSVGNKVINYPCLEYHIERCDAPCIGKVTPEEYQENIDEIISFLQGKHSGVIEALKVKMQRAAENKQFELAARLRDKLLAVEDISEKQKISEATHESRDVISFVIQNEKAFFNLFIVRDGKLVNQENFILDTKLKGLFDPYDPVIRSEILEGFMREYYSSTSDYPHEVLVTEDEMELQLLSEWLTLLAERKVEVKVPQKGKKSHLIEFSQKNAASYARQCQVKWDTEEARTIGATVDLATAFNVVGDDGTPVPFKRIECFDISHFSGHETVASMAVFIDGKPRKSDYRHFTIRTLEKGKVDDFSSLEEVLTRRLKYLQSELPSKSDKLKKDAAPYKVRKAKKDDIKTINKMKLASGFNEAKDHKQFYVLTFEDDIVGIIALKDRKSEDGHVVYHLKNLYINPAHRGKNLGKYLIARVFSLAKVDLIYIVIGTEMIDYYSDLGFKRIKDKDVPELLSESFKAVEQKHDLGATVMSFEIGKDFSPYLDTRCQKTEEEGGGMTFSVQVAGSSVAEMKVEKVDSYYIITEFNVIDSYLEKGVELILLDRCIKDFKAKKLYFSTSTPKKYYEFGFEKLKTHPSKLDTYHDPKNDMLGYIASKRTKKDPSFTSVPDLIIIDGGKGQLSSAVKAANKLGFKEYEDILICSLAKRHEDIFLPGKKTPLHLDKDSSAQFLVQRIRDEAHRFAITHNRKRREKNMFL